MNNEKSLLTGLFCEVIPEYSMGPGLLRHGVYHDANCKQATDK